MRLAQMKIMNAFDPLQIVQIAFKSTVGHIEFDTNHSGRLGGKIGNDRNPRGDCSAIGVVRFVEALRQLSAVDVAESDDFLLIVFGETFVELLSLLASVPNSELGPVVEDVFLKFSESEAPDGVLADAEGG